MKVERFVHAKFYTEETHGKQGSAPTVGMQLAISQSGAGKVNRLWCQKKPESTIIQTSKGK
jgi:hypothetical protein